MIVKRHPLLRVATKRNHYVTVVRTVRSETCNLHTVAARQRDNCVCNMVSRTRGVLKLWVKFDDGIKPSSVPAINIHVVTPHVSERLVGGKHNDLTAKYNFSPVA